MSSVKLSFELKNWRIR